MSTTRTPPRRKDALRNRGALLEAARLEYAEHGLDARLDQVAKRAGVAIGTLYNHFPTRMDLVAALFRDKLEQWVETAEVAAEMDDAWAGFVLFVETMCELQATDQGFNDMASIRFPQSAGLDDLHARIQTLGRRIVERAQEQGSLREDVSSTDLPFVIWSHTRVSQATRDIAPEVWRRHLHLMLDGFRAVNAHPLPVPPMTHEQVYEAMVRLGNGGCTEA